MYTSCSQTKRCFLKQAFNIDALKSRKKKLRGGALYMYKLQANGEVENMNKSILKRLQIAHSNHTDYQTEIQKFIPMYNSTPHGTTGKSLAQLVFGRNIRHKIPSIEDLIAHEGNEEPRYNDIRNNHKGKEREGSDRGSTSH